MESRKLISCVFAWILVVSLLACSQVSPKTASTATFLPTIVVNQVERETKIPANALKMIPETDDHPPIVYSSDYKQPVPIPGAVNTAGAEDSPFILPDGNTLYFFFTPDVNVPVEKQILDGVTGIYVSKKVNGEWGRPDRIILQDSGKIAGDGCEFVMGDTMWFCSVREGYSGIHWFTAEFNDGMWQNWKIADFDPGYQVGELHIAREGSELYFGSERAGGKGKLDIWVSKKIDGSWQEPINIAAVNTPDSEGWPAISINGNELWFTRNYGIWRSVKVNVEWQEASLVVAPLAGEPSMDEAGNLYFVHHFYQEDRMIEADLYVAYRK